MALSKGFMTIKPCEESQSVKIKNLSYFFLFLRDWDEKVKVPQNWQFEAQRKTIDKFSVKINVLTLNVPIPDKVKKLS